MQDKECKTIVFMLNRKSPARVEIDAYHQYKFYSQQQSHSFENHQQIIYQNNTAAAISKFTSVFLNTIYCIVMACHLAAYNDCCGPRAINSL
mmetsp:Transcript_14055/g.32411  ORF Transcript_14055/g.32411 Transcript_14055/m.32411 type:complete len:92 (-) Transcript_14055:2066-2341(-)